MTLDTLCARLATVGASGRSARGGPAAPSGAPRARARASRAPARATCEAKRRAQRDTVHAEYTIHLRLETSAEGARVPRETLVTES